MILVPSRALQARNSNHVVQPTSAGVTSACGAEIMVEPCEIFFLFSMVLPVGDSDTDGVLIMLSYRPNLARLCS